MEIFNRYFWTALGITITLPIIQKFLNRNSDVDQHDIDRVMSKTYPAYYPIIFWFTILFMVGISVVPAALVAYPLSNLLTMHSFTGYTDGQFLSALQLITLITYFLIPFLFVMTSVFLILSKIFDKYLPEKFMDYGIKRNYEAGWRISDKRGTKMGYYFLLYSGLLYLTMTILFYFKILHF